MPLPAAQVGVAHDQAPTASYAYVIKYANSSTTVCLTGWEQAVAISGLPAFLDLDEPQAFTAAQVSHGEVNSSGAHEKREVQILFGVSDDRLSRYFATASAEKITIYIIRIAAEKLLTGEALDYDTDCFLLTSGLIGRVTIEGVQIGVTITPEPFLDNQNVPRFFFSRACNHHLGSEACGVDREAFKATATITAIDAAQKIVELSITPPGGNAEFFRAGHMVHAATGLVVGIIWSDAGGTAGAVRLRLHFWSLDLATGQTITAYAGCRHTLGDCVSKFANGANYGGFPYIPNRNPVTHGIEG